MKDKLFDRLVKRGTLVVSIGEREQSRYGSGEPVAHVHLKDRRVIARLLSDPEMAFGEAYVDGDWWPGRGGLAKVFELYFANAEHIGGSRLMSLARRALRGLTEVNGKLRSARNVAHHYDIDNDLFQRFLDPEMQYSCAYWSHRDMTLDDAQLAKLDHIARKLTLSPGDKVLDIGCGWGGMALYLARHYDVEVVGLTLSDDQYGHAVKRAEALGLSHRVTFAKQDYRDHRGAYDAIVSVGMFEHVGRPQYQTFFDQVSRLLKPDGRSLIHTIGRNGPPPADSRTWIQKHIFPGGYIPSLSEISPCVETSGLVLADLEVWRRHYAETLKAWNTRFQAQRELFSQRLGERFCRMWEFYLLGCEAVFRYGDLIVFHVQVSHTNEAVPVTRDYLYKQYATHPPELTSISARTLDSVG
ncbi:SAM-dependent methyltransferase [Salinisphaera japonica]|uniref:Cyclopropane-fatty-acyl-phospholipid synthase n=1 Tax=Salinisphaera japonica YTM-1 TaxID=1209778 RepID=A0A423Q2S7_9GAMM|nr:cyclopropane-fatty-acyl-phospholipid synthase family protein [Salinisphaera japonica]ROO32818.1 cyclopropane-fatty-acyl-phospholipid synthase [Salinisphaera japonica YTM-1]